MVGQKWMEHLACVRDGSEKSLVNGYQNMMAILTAVAYFAMVYLGLRTKMRVLARHVMGAARRLFGIPDFHFCALADGIREYLFGRQSGLNGFHNQWIEDIKQLSLFNP